MRRETHDHLNGGEKKKLLTKFCLHDKSVRKLGLEKTLLK